MKKLSTRLETELVEGATSQEERLRHGVVRGKNRLVASIASARGKIATPVPQAGDQEDGGREEAVAAGEGIKIRRGDQEEGGREEAVAAGEGIKIKKAERRADPTPRS